ncbi:MAG: Hsp70 family protein [Bacteroidota bacterium]
MEAPPRRTPLRIGIDLGTTFSCVAALDERGRTVIVRNRSGSLTTPSVVWFDGHEAVVGACAYAYERRSPGYLNAFVKRDTGKPPSIPPELYDRDDAPPTAPYARDGYDWGVPGMQALVLRQLRADALALFRETGQLAPDTPDDEAQVEAVVTVPAYFRDIEREQTHQAAEIAGLRVRALINEPTAAALAYQVARSDTKRVFVFDLGGGTFDVTILDVFADGRAEVLASEGNPHLGGKDWDEVILRYLSDEWTLATGARPDEAQRLELRLLATEAKIALSTAETAEVALPLPDGSEALRTLHRAPAADANPILLDLDDDTFFFETRCTNLLTQVRAICQMALDEAQLPGSGAQSWSYIDEIVMVGGSCRMPMIPALLEAMAGGYHTVERNPRGFDFDTAVATGAALYCQRADRVRDVSPGTYGIKIKDRARDRYVVKHLIHKNDPLPITVERAFYAGAKAALELYQGAFTSLADCILRGRIELNNPEGPIRVLLHMGPDGTLSAACVLPDGERRTVTIRNEFFDDRTAELVERVRGVRLIPCAAPSRPDGSSDDPDGGDDPDGHTTLAIDA